MSRSRDSQWRPRNDKKPKWFRELTSREAEVLLGELCIQLGFCLPPEQNRAIIDEIPKTPGLFVDKVLELEGLEFPNDELKRQMLELTEQYFAENRTQRF